MKPQKVIPREFDSGQLTQPVSIPDQVAIIDEDYQPPSAGIAGVVGGVPGGQVGGQIGGVIGGIISSAPTVAPPPPPPPPVKKKAAPKRIRVGGNVAKARLLRQVRPQYPPLARQARIQGTVKLSAVIAKDGTIQKLEVTNGHPLLVPAALAAVKQWRYKPTLLNGEAVVGSDQYRRELHPQRVIRRRTSLPFEGGLPGSRRAPGSPDKRSAGLKVGLRVKNLFV